MRIFKNRGDIYFSKTNKEKSKEQKILFIALIAIIAVTVIFVGILCITNDFSAKKFFAPDELPTDNKITVDYEDEIDLPEVSGKTNYAVMLKKEDILLFTILIQSDMDNKAFKVSTLKGDTQIDGNSLSDIFASSGAQNVMTAVENELGCDFDYYMAIDSNDYADFFDMLGKVNYPILNDIKYKEENSKVTYSLKIKSGEQSIDGKSFVNLIRYYIDSENNFSQANELVLAALAQQLNSENMADSDDMFKNFVKIADTNITVRDFSVSSDKLIVISNDQSAMGVYNAALQYDENKISDEGLKKVKSYFVK